MNKIYFPLLFIFMLAFSTRILADNVPAVPDISGPSKVFVGAQNVTYRLVNFNHSIISAIWTLENCDTHEVVTNINTSSSTTFDFPLTPCSMIADVTVTYMEDDYEEEVLYAMCVECLIVQLDSVRREGIDMIYNGISPDVPIHFNINYDGIDGTPDFINPGPLQGSDNDLLYLRMGLSPANVDFSGCVLEIEIAGSSARLWTNKRKTQAPYDNVNKYALVGNSICNLSFVTLYVEACSLGSFNITVKINGTKIHSSNMRYNAYAVTEGIQPPRGSHIGELRDCEWSLLNSMVGTSNITSALAWVVDPDASKYGVPVIVTKTHPRIPDPYVPILSNYFGVSAYYTNVDAFGDNDGEFEMQDVLSYFEPQNWNVNYTPCISGGTIIYYNDFHAAREFPGYCPGTRPSWNMYMSKHPARLVVLHRDIHAGMGNITLRLLETPVTENPEEE